MNRNSNVKLTNLTLKDISVDSIHKLDATLRSAHNIRYLHLDLYMSQGLEVHPIRPPISYPYLEKLALELHYFSPLLFTSFNAPNLKEMTLAGINAPGEDHWDAEIADIVSLPNRFPKLSVVEFEDIELAFFNDSGGISGAAAALVRAHAQSLRRVQISTEEEFSFLPLDEDWSRDFFNVAFGAGPEGSYAVVAPPALKELNFLVNPDWDEDPTEEPEDAVSLTVHYLQQLLRSSEKLHVSWEVEKPNWGVGFDALKTEFGKRLRLRLEGYGIELEDEVSEGDEDESAELGSTG